MVSSGGFKDRDEEVIVEITFSLFLRRMVVADGGLTCSWVGFYQLGSYQFR